MPKAKAPKATPEVFPRREKLSQFLAAQESSTVPIVPVRVADLEGRLPEDDCLVRVSDAVLLAYRYLAESKDHVVLSILTRCASQYGLLPQERERRSEAARRAHEGNEGYRLWEMDGGDRDNCPQEYRGFPVLPPCVENYKMHMGFLDFGYTVVEVKNEREYCHAVRWAEFTRWLGLAHRLNPCLGFHSHMAEIPAAVDTPGDKLLRAFDDIKIALAIYLKSQKQDALDGGSVTSARYCLSDARNSLIDISESIGHAGSTDITRPLFAFAATLRSWPLTPEGWEVIEQSHWPAAYAAAQAVKATAGTGTQTSPGDISEAPATQRKTPGAGRTKARKNSKDAIVWRNWKESGCGKFIDFLHGFSDTIPQAYRSYEAMIRLQGRMKKTNPE
jgi:hypothetical protein